MEFIITCGTSQTDKLNDEGICKDSLHLDLRDIGYTDIQSYFDKEVVDQDNSFEKDSQDSIKAIVKSIVNLLNQKRLDLIGTDKNPFGAEVSTIFAYLSEKCALDKQHEFHILRSDTYIGWFNALILKEVLQKVGWGVTSSILPVVNLRERPPLGSDPLLSLSKHLTNILGKRRQTNDPPTIISSGGFKSAIPCLTVFSILYALPMVYLFETSNKIEELTPVLSVGRKSKYHQLWEDLAKMQVAGNLPWFQEALSFRTSDEAKAIRWLSD